MKRMHLLSAVVVIALVLLIVRESEAVIYKYMSEQGVPSFADDLQKVPEQFRAQAVIVTGGSDYDAYAEQEKARVAAQARADQEQQRQAASAVQNEETLRTRLIRSGIAIILFAALLFVVANIHALQEQAKVLLRVRAGLALVLLLFLGYTHFGDVAGLLGNAWERISNPITSAQDRSAERGRKAAQAYKAMNKVLETGELPEEQRQKESER